MSYLFDSNSNEQVVPVSELRGGRAINFRDPQPSEILLYTSPRSFYSQLVLMSLYYKGIEFTNESLDIQAGEQFKPSYLELNPRGEVPVMRCGKTNTTITDSLQMIQHIDELFKNEKVEDPKSKEQKKEIPKLYPDNATEKHRCGELLRKMHALKLEMLTFGSIQHIGLDIEPHKMYKSDTSRKAIQDYLKRRRAIYRTEIVHYPQYAETLKGKLRDIEHDWHFLEKRDDYERLITTFETVLDECEAELQIMEQKRDKLVKKMKEQNPDKSIEWDPSLDVPPFWLCSKQITVADICLGIILNRIYEIGFSKRLIKSRKNISAYFDRIRGLDCFQKALAEPPPKNYFWWIVLIPLGTVLTFALWGLVQGTPLPNIFTPVRLPRLQFPSVALRNRPSLKELPSTRPT